MENQDGNYAIRIEKKLRNIYNCDRGGVGGMVDSAFIKSSPYSAMIATLMFLYKEKDSELREKIENFISEYQFYSSYKIKEIIQEKGEEEFEKMMKNFFELIK